MKKFVSAVAVLALVAFAAPALAATNPFMDVPMNHWAYDAIGQLAAHGILSGYPDGTYKGKQPTTRYEMASALARALAVVDMTKASRQDVEMLQRLIVEFHDELEALGVRVDEMEGKVNKLDSRLGGWKLSGRLRLDVLNEDHDAPTPDSSITGANFRLFVEKFWGENDEYHFLTRLDRSGSNDGVAFSRYYIDMPFFFDTTLTAGKFGWDMEADYYLGGSFGLPENGEFGLDSVLTDRATTGLGITKQFGLGTVQGYVAHPQSSFLGSGKDAKGTDTNYSAWELFGMGKFQFNEQFGFDLGGQAFIGDNAEPATPAADDYHLASLWTIFGGLRFDFNDSIGFKGIYYYQKHKEDDFGANGWSQRDDDNVNHWRAIVSVKQDVLKFTSAWLEYGQVDAGFVSPMGGDDFFFAASPLSKGRFPGDLKYWRIALGQEWNDKWATSLFYSGYDFDDGTADLENEWGLGVRYTYGNGVTFNLQYVNIGNDVADDDHVVRFRTQVVF